MDLAISLSGPLAQRLTWTLLHFLWQGALLAGLLEMAAYLLDVRAMAARYRISLATLMLMAACPAATFCLVRPDVVSTPRSHAPRGNGLMAAPRPRDRTWTQSVLAFRSQAERGNEAEERGNEAELAELPLPLLPAPIVDPDASAPHAPPPRVSLFVRWQPYLLCGWAIGASLFGLRLLIGGGTAWRMRRGRLPLDQAWSDRARRLARRTGLARARVFVSTRVRQALVTGVLRPMVLLPAAWLAEMPPEMLEGVLAHELAHLRRLDLWAILLQRLVETLLFYHPAVWWLSRRLHREREMCCDEMAVAAIGDRLAFTKALQWAVQQPAAGAGPVLGAAWKGNRKMVLERIRRLLGAETPRERFSWWPLGLAALAAPALLMLSGVFAKEGPKPAKPPEDHTPTLAEIAKANDAAWAAIRSVDMEYETTVALVIDGKKVREFRSPNQRWSKEGDRERTHGRCTCFSSFDADKLLRNQFDASLFGESTQYTDCYLDGKNEWTFRDNCCRQCISPQSPKTDLARQWLRYVYIDGSDMTLSELFTARRVTIKGKQKSKDGDTLWVLETDDPTSYGEDGAGKREKGPPTCTRIYVNADKGFLISRVAYNIFTTDPGRKNLQAFEECRFDEVTKFQECGRGVYFPSSAVTESRVFSVDPKNATQCYVLNTCCATRLSVNAPLPGDAFAFRFPDHAVVYQELAGSKDRKVMIWGADNKPVKEFATTKDYDDFANREELAAMAKEVQQKQGSKEPADLMQRIEYYIEKKDYDKALAATEALIAADPKSETAAAAHAACGEICLMRGRDFARAAAELTESLQWYVAKNVAEKGKDGTRMDLRPFYFVRGLAYANLSDGLDRALADLTKAIDYKSPPDPAVLAARLVRSAIYLRRNELDKIGPDIAALLHGDFHFPEVYGILYLLAKQSDPAKAEAIRQQHTAMLGAPRRPSAEWGDFDEVLGPVLHRTLLRLLPSLEGLAPAPGSPETKVPAKQPQASGAGVTRQSTAATDAPHDQGNPADNRAASTNYFASGTPGQPHGQRPNPAVPCDMSLTLGRVGDDVVLAGDLLQRIDETIAYRRVPPEKRDEQRAALVKEVTDAIRDYAAHVAAGEPDPAKGMSESHRLLLYSMVRQSLDVKMLYQDFRKAVPKQGQEEVQERVDRYFDDTQVKALMKREKVATPADLENALRANGASLDCERKSFAEQFIAQQWIMQKVKPETGPEITQRDMNRVFKELCAKYPISTVFDAAMKSAPAPDNRDAAKQPQPKGTGTTKPYSPAMEAAQPKAGGTVYGKITIEPDSANTQPSPQARGATEPPYGGNVSIDLGIADLRRPPRVLLADEPMTAEQAQRKLLEQMRAEVEKNRNSTNPADLLQRGEYYLAANDFDKALTAFAAVIAADPKSHSAAMAHAGRGIINLVSPRDFAKAAAEFSDYLHWYEARNMAEKGKNAIEADQGIVYFLRGLAYANQADGLEKARADMTTIINAGTSMELRVVCNATLVRSAIYFRRNELDKARADITKALQFGGLPAEAYGISSLIYAKQGSKARAEEERARFAKKFAADLQPGRAPAYTIDAYFGVIRDSTLWRLVPALQKFAPLCDASDLSAPPPPSPAIGTAARNPYSFAPPADAQPCPVPTGASQPPKRATGGEVARYCGEFVDAERYRIEPPDVLRIEVTQYPGRKTVLDGYYLVGPDDSINLREYGTAKVAGLTEREAEQRVVEAVSHSSKAQPSGEYSARVQVAANNSKVVLVIISSTDKGDLARRLPVDRSTTVASAILQADGAAALAAKGPVWLARPNKKAALDGAKWEIKQIDWPAIVQRGSVEANLPLQPGDRIYIGRRPPEGGSKAAPVSAIKSSTAAAKRGGYQVEGELFSADISNGGKRIVANNGPYSRSVAMDVPDNCTATDFIVNGDDLLACVLHGDPVSQLILFDNKLGKWMTYPLPADQRPREVRPIVGAHVACYPLKDCVIAYSATKHRWGMLPGGTSPVVGDYGIRAEAAGEKHEFTDETGRWERMKMSSAAEGPTFTARAARLSYSPGKDQMILEGDSRSDAELYKQEKEGGAVQSFKAQKIIYFKKTGQVNVDGFRSLQMNQPPEKPAAAGQRDR